MLLVALPEHLQVVLQLLLVQQVGGHHFLEVLLQLLDALLQCDLTLVVVIHVVRAQLLDLLLEASLSLLSPLQELGLLHLPPLLEESLDLRLVFAEELGALLLKGILDLFQLPLVVLPHRVMLLAHLPDEASDVGTLRLQHLDVLLILVLQLRLEVPDPAILGLDDLLASPLLVLQLVIELLRNVRVEEVSPLHLDGRILPAASHSLDLQGLVAVEAVIFLDDTPLILLVIEANADVGELVPSLRADSLQHRRRGSHLLLADGNLLLHLVLLGLLAFGLLLISLHLGLCPLAARHDAILLVVQGSYLHGRHHGGRGATLTGAGTTEAPPLPVAP
mmetsp:Transcript_76016/g.163145  ORF Transcript_76016/g.163145 Transcript_76016/m.163145 type:complete len:334 (+) Transcript_76016:1164-2165(+)